MKIWESLDLARDDWWTLAAAFYCAAHRDFKKLDALPENLKGHRAAQLCREYREKHDHRIIDEAGYLLTHTRQWYIYLGRIM